MKKLKTLFLVATLIFCYMICFIVSTPSKVSSANDINISVAEFYNTANSILNDFVQFDSRFPGSEDEKVAAEYIAEYLNTNTNCVPFTNDYITNGVQSFRFDSTLDGNTYSSQNVIYTHKSSNASSPKVIIGCSYDAIAFKYGTYQAEGELVASESVNGSAGSVSLLLTMAKYLSTKSFNFDIDFIFFGAGESNNAGSNFYTQGISNDDAKEIALMINLDKVSLGKNIYFYVDEIENDFSKYVKNLSSSNNLGIKKVSTSNLGKSLHYYEDKLGLGYSHIALTSNNVNFMSSNILTMNYFAGDYSSGVVLGLREYGDNDILTYTDYDSISKISEIYGESTIIDNLYTVYNSVDTMLGDSQFISVCQSSAGQTNWIYVFFGNKKLLAYLTMVVIIIFVSIIFYINFKLTKNSYYANIEMEFVKSVVTISSNIDEHSVSKDVTEIVSDVLVHDIKKDKRIKKKKK